MWGRSPEVIATFPGADTVDVPRGLRAARRRAEVVVVATAPCASWVAQWCADFPRAPRPLAQQPVGEVVIDALRAQAQRRTALLLVPPPPLPMPAAIAMLDRLAGLLAADPDLLPPDERESILTDVTRRMPHTDAGAPAPIAAPTAVLDQGAAIEAWVEEHEVALHGPRDVLRPAHAEPVALTPDEVADTAAQLVAHALEDLRGVVRRQAKREGGPADPREWVVHDG